MSEDQSKRDRFKDNWRSLWKLPRTWLMLGIPIGGFLMFVAGIAFVAVTVTMVSWSNSLEFCISCHEMESTVYQEYKETVHYQNESGVRTICTDCHVPEEYPDKLIVKLRASFNELPKHFLGTIDTAEKFEANRAHMAESVWETMRENDSRECRKCHSYDAMALSMQGRSASKKHSAEWRKRKDETCIDCHQGIAHKLPEL